MTDPIEHVRQKLVERIARIIEDHRAPDIDADVACSCGAQGSPDHSHHVAEQIVHQLGLMPDTVDEVRKRIRYVSAVLDWELTKFEGAQC
jgi:hypothetical protein